MQRPAKPWTPVRFRPQPPNAVWHNSASSSVTGLPMNSASERIVLALVILVLDVAVFVLPITGLFAAYVLLVRPPWFRIWVGELYKGT